MSLADFQILSANIVQVKGEQDGMTYFSFVSALLSLVAAVRERHDFALYKQKEIRLNTFLSLIIRTIPGNFFISMYHQNHQQHRRIAPCQISFNRSLGLIVWV